jgi:hypothetical protein
MERTLVKGSPEDVVFYVEHLYPVIVILLAKWFLIDKLRILISWNALIFIHI